MSKTTIPAGGITDGTLTSAKLDQDGAFTFNEDSADVDFRVESNGNANAFIVDASTDRVGFGIAAPETEMHIQSTSGECELRMTAGSTSDARIRFGDTDDTDAGYIGYSRANGVINMRATSSGAADVEIKGTKVGIGTSGNFTPTQRLNVYGSHVSESGLVRIQTSNGSGDTALIKMLDGNSDTCGEITLNAGGNSVAYGTSSDYRLKENEVAISDGIERLKQLKPYKFNFKSQPEKTVDGFFAHEVSSIVPEAINGEKDGDKMQSIDQSKLVPLLTSALQEAITEIESLKARVTTLEG